MKSSKEINKSITESHVEAWMLSQFQCERDTRISYEASYLLLSLNTGTNVPLQHTLL